MPTRPIGYDKFLRGYIEGMLFANVWSGEGTRDERGRRLAETAQKDALDDCLDFMEAVEREEWDEWDEYVLEHGPEQGGTDFALSRNGHGAGFFDTGLGFPRLQKLAKQWGSRTWFVLEDGTVGCD